MQFLNYEAKHFLPNFSHISWALLHVVVQQLLKRNRNAAHDNFVSQVSSYSALIQITPYLREAATVLGFLFSHISVRAPSPPTPQHES